MKKYARKVTRNLHELAGMPPKLATVDDLRGATPVVSGRPEGRNAARDRKTSTRASRINLAMVCDALADEGLDPAVEIARMLKGKPVLDENGEPVLDADGKPKRIYEIDAETRLRTHNALLEYLQPKLKSVEMKVTGSLDSLTGEQLDERIGLLMAKMNGAKRPKVSK